MRLIFEKAVSAYQIDFSLTVYHTDERLEQKRHSDLWGNQKSGR